MTVHPFGPSDRSLKFDFVFLCELRASVARLIPDFNAENAACQ